MKTAARIALICLALASPALRADEAAEPANLRQMMSEAEFRAAGLEKLSPEELAALNRWLGGRIEQEKTVAATEAREEAVAQAAPPPPPPPPPAITPEEAFGAESLPEPVAERTQPQEVDEIESALTGEFNGWSGYTRFKLENGQVWIQAEPGKMRVRKMDKPKVTIRRGMLGAYFLQVEGYGRRVKVERIR